MNYTLIGICLWCFIGLVLWFIRPNSPLHQGYFSMGKTAQRWFSVILCVATILLCVLPMTVSPIWTGEEVTYRNQYEVMADRMLEGHLTFDYEPDPALLAMENPYDRDARDEQGVEYHWDHAFYNGKYYMYFGVVPEFLAFIPYKLITGQSLPSYRATRLFTAVFIIGLFVMMKKLAERYFPKLTKAAYAFGCVSFSVFSAWYFTAAPAMYCTAISAAVCLEIWSIILFYSALFETKTEKGTVAAMTAGSLLGALVFGCRPPVALANIVFFPFLIAIIRAKKIKKRLIPRVALILLPYVVVGISLMLYNYVRFDNPFEFGQSYQLTVADQSHYGNLLSRLKPKTILRTIRYYLADFRPNKDLPHIGILIASPMITLSILWILCCKKGLKALFTSDILPCFLTLCLAVGIIIVFNSACAPYPRPRYRADFNWILSLLSFIAIGYVLEHTRIPKAASTVFALLMFGSVLFTAVQFVVPYDYNFTKYYNIDVMPILKHIFTCGIL